ncbi:hypothetical protein [Zooshikella harenae]|uniref:Uncharacterized protein n=1 Tax=Zooshikella harenae TaxID=2827238 RepID=A0ABS5ZAP6_9GAMM|nr:hypothetical protein [Zooshikella harenae]MBU2711074.1 hypothetical protein [Zooshikella harenae]
MLKRSISYQVSPTSVNNIRNARKQSQHMESIFSHIEHHEAQQDQRMWQRAQRIEQRATTSQGFLHHEFTAKNLYRVMKVNNPELTIKKDFSQNYYDHTTHTAGLIEPEKFEKVDMIAHEAQHHLDKLTNPKLHEMDVVGKEYSAFSSQFKVAKQLGFKANMPFPQSPLQSAETYREKSTSRFRKL